MCTLTWWPAPAGYDLWFNRDELDSRAPELPPRETRHGEVRFLAPRDGDQGGTWLAVNEGGLTVALLNDYGASWRAGEPRRSRGALVLACAAHVSLDAVAAEVAGSELAQTAAFHLFAIDAAASPLVLHWDGERLRTARAAEVPAFLSSSSYRTADVIAHRWELFRELIGGGRQPGETEIMAFHRRHDPEAGAYSVCMRRADASTRSLTRVHVRPEAVELTYQPLAWTAPAPAGQRLRLAREPVHG